MVEQKIYYTLVLLASLVINVASERCYYQRCLGCRTGAEGQTGTSVECYPEYWVSPEWIHNLGHQPPSTSSKVPLEYRCIKMTATPDNNVNHGTVDVLKGCVPKVQVDSICLALVATERARGHSDARCYVCRGDNCNYASSTYNISILLIASLLLMLCKICR